MSNAAKAGEADPLVVRGENAADFVDEIDDREEPSEQHLQRDKFTPPQKIEVPLGERKEGQHHFGHHNERLHRLLAAILRSDPGEAVLE